MNFVASTLLLVALLSAAFATNWQVDVGYGAGAPFPGSPVQWSVFRFFPENLTIVQGDTVTWTLRNDGTRSFSSFSTHYLTRLCRPLCHLFSCYFTSFQGYRQLVLRPCPLSYSTDYWNFGKSDRYRERDGNLQCWSDVLSKIS